ncbi:DUF4365 domain-containing protein [Tychonema sp. LEGE 07199]|uniref:DUF4365 domain-containing protein n=1 Tax=unclassified Tychonema TaxID=2642144 RepID=UPI00187FC6D3|nr:MULTISPECIES: DUF4365 domain-containing protein [unclassified Tychonema]MBE9120363.1 DUF4365 domain-containing protein [Tychonema sp. LEGE 07199]MBE9130657.1 DUF4365 domain-containing protein [Tychonema sp. LEGE 07196]
MELNQQKELFSKAYVRAVAAVAGFSLSQPEVDDDSIDLKIVARGGEGVVFSPELNLQLKCTSRDVLDGQFIRYPVRIKNYRDLIVNSQVPRLLVVVLVPENLENWLQQSEDEMCIRYCAYWVSLRGLPERLNTANVTVELPRSNQFTVEALKSIVQRLSQGGLP